MADHVTYVRVVQDYMRPADSEDVKPEVVKCGEECELVLQYDDYWWYVRRAGGGSSEQPFYIPAEYVQLIEMVSSSSATTTTTTVFTDANVDEFHAALQALNSVGETASHVTNPAGVTGAIYRQSSVEIESLVKPSVFRSSTLNRPRTTPRSMSLRESGTETLPARTAGGPVAARRTWMKPANTAGVTGGEEGVNNSPDGSCTTSPTEELYTSMVVRHSSLDSQHLPRPVRPTTRRTAVFPPISDTEMLQDASQVTADHRKTSIDRTVYTPPPLPEISADTNNNSNNNIIVADIGGFDEEEYDDDKSDYVVYSPSIARGAAPSPVAPVRLQDQRTNSGSYDDHESFYMNFSTQSSSSCGKLSPRDASRSPLDTATTTGSGLSPVDIQHRTLPAFPSRTTTTTTQGQRHEVLQPAVTTTAAVAAAATARPTTHRDQQCNVFNERMIDGGGQQEQEAPVKSTTPVMLNKEGLVDCRHTRENGRLVSPQVWNKAYIVLTGAIVSFYKDEASSKTRSDVKYNTPVPYTSIILQGAVIQMTTRDNITFDILRITTSTNTQFLIQTHNITETQSWCFCLKNNVAILLAKRSALIENATPLSTFTPSIDPDTPTTPQTPQTPSPLSKSKGPLFDMSRIAQMLKDLLTRRPTRDDLKKRGIYTDPVFGSSLSVVCARDATKVPQFLINCFREIEQRGLDTDGIYRHSGSVSQIQKLRIQVNQSEYDVNGYDIHTLTGAVKLFFRELTEPLVPFSLLDRFLEANSVTSASAKHDTFIDVIKLLPDENRETFKELLIHLERVCAHSAENQMTAHNLAIVFGPTLMWVSCPTEQSLSTTVVMQGKIVEYMIAEQRSLFA